MVEPVASLAEEGDLAREALTLKELGDPSI
jgi:hypothetical protein